MTAPNVATVPIAAREGVHDRLITAPVAILVASASLTPTPRAATTVPANVKTATLADVMTEIGTVATVLSELSGVNGASVEVIEVTAVAGTLTTDPVGTCSTIDEVVVEVETVEIVEIVEIGETVREESERGVPHLRVVRSLHPT